MFEDEFIDEEAPEDDAVVDSVSDDAPVEDAEAVPAGEGVVFTRLPNGKLVRL